MTRKKKPTEEVIEVAQEIATVVASEPKSEVKPEPPKPASSPKPSKAKKEEIVEVVQANTAPVRNVRVKATATVRGVYQNMRYSIKEGEVYTFPEEMVKWLKESGRVI